jgi:hypothetical protein
MLSKPCHLCRKLVTRSPKEFARSTTGRIYCSRSCAATFNNHTMPKRAKSTRCTTCQVPIRWGYRRCKACHEAQRRLDQKTLLEATLGRRDASRYTGVRSHARKVYAESGKPKQCAVCGYSKHVEICHIRDISTYPMETPVIEINAVSNLVALCPNHHWELDRGLLEVGLTGFEPV